MLPPQDRLQALTRHTERVLALELRPSRVKNAHAALGRPLARSRQQAGLADTRRSLHQQHRTHARARRYKQSLKARELLLALHQWNRASIRSPRSFPYLGRGAFPSRLLPADLGHRYRPRDSAQTPLAGGTHELGHARHGNVADNLGGQDLAGRGGVAEPARNDHRRAVEVFAVGERLAGVQPDPQPELSRRPGRGALHVDRAAHSCDGA